MKQKITTCLWFDGRAEEAATFYVSVFRSGRILETVHWGKTGPGKEGAVLTVRFEIEGQEFLALNGGPQYHFTPAISLSVGCKTQQEVDAYWEKLTDGGKPVQCGWLTDKFGVSWQIVPDILPKALVDKDRARADRVLKAMMGMVKLDIAKLQEAYDDR